MATATVDALSQIVAGVGAYFADPSRNVVADVEAGEWNVERHNGPPYVVIGHGPFQYAGAAAVANRTAPSHWWKITDTLYAPVVGQRDQTFLVWVHSPAPGDFTSTDPTQIAVLAQVATMALSDLTYAALRDIHGHDLTPGPGKVLNPERGEFTYGSVVSWGFTIPVPVLGDTYTYENAQVMGMTVATVVNGTPSTPADVATGP
jgi:hypothetical protein